MTDRDGRRRSEGGGGGNAEDVRDATFTAAATRAGLQRLTECGSSGGTSGGDDGGPATAPGGMAPFVDLYPRHRTTDQPAGRGRAQHDPTRSRAGAGR